VGVGGHGLEGAVKPGKSRAAAIHGAVQSCPVVKFRFRKDLRTAYHRGARAALLLRKIQLRSVLRKPRTSTVPARKISAESVS